MSPSIESASVLPMPMLHGRSKGMGKRVGIDGMSIDLARLSVGGEKA